MALKKFAIGLFGTQTSFDARWLGRGEVLINITILLVVLDELLTLNLISPQIPRTLKA